METSTTPTTLLELLDAGPASKTAVVLPEQRVEISYGALRAQVRQLADQLTEAGISRGDRVGIALPNGLPMLVCVPGGVSGRYGGAAESRLPRR